MQILRGNVVKTIGSKGNRTKEETLKKKIKVFNFKQFLGSSDVQRLKSDFVSLMKLGLPVVAAGIKLSRRLCVARYHK